MNILFVCTANINRSFMAERIFSGELKKHGKTDISFSSAALLDMQEEAADPNAVKLLVENGYDGSGHRSRMLSEDMISKADLILVMEDQQRKWIIDRYPPSESKIRLLKSYAKDYAEDNGDIRDPHRMSVYHYRLCFAEIYMSIQGLLKCI